MKPLSLENSRRLMYVRIFGEEHKDKCPDEQLEEVLNRILKKCDGVPLAIITIASLLASKGRNKLDWFDVCNSIGDGLEKNNTVEDMRKVLSLSYYNMPSHLRTCLLYLSMFPEDYDIKKDRLIWLWIAEGFVQSEKQDKSLFEIGESYLIELINRSMIQPRHNIQSGMIESCRVHDMVLDLICFMSSEENFASIQNNVDQSLSASKKVRRLSLQNGKVSHDKLETTLSKEQHVRSVIVFQSAIVCIPIKVLENFGILRVLDLDGCVLPRGYSLKYLGNLLHLRYLGLRDTYINHLPEEIGNLQFLQMLDVKTIFGIKILPSSIVRLTQLMRLCINEETRVPEGIIGSLTALEELSCLRISCKGKMLEELARLTLLKVLYLKIITGDSFEIPIHQPNLESDDGMDRSVVECLNMLQKIQSLVITIENRECNLDGWVVTAPQNLRNLQLCFPCKFATLPAWLKVNSSLLLNLCSLRIVVKRLKQEDLEILGRLPALYFLSLIVGHEDSRDHRFLVGACSFPCLVHCVLCGFRGPVVFEQGAMPRLVDLELHFPVQRTREITGSLDLGLGNLLSLQEAKVWLQFESEQPGEEELEEAKAAVRHVAFVHPNRPKFCIILANGVIVENVNKDPDPLPEAECVVMTVQDLNELLSMNTWP